MTQDTLNTHLLQSAEAVQSALDSGKTVVFSGGACNCITTEGTKVRNTARDSLNGYLAENDIFYFDPQIHPDTHGREYNYDVDGPGEQTARSLAAVTIYQIGDDTLGAVTGLEAVRDAVGGKKVVLWLSGEHDAKNKPMFVPQGVNTEGLDPATKAHLGEYVSGGQKLRQNLRDFIKGFSNVRVVRTEDEAKAALQELTQIWTSIHDGRYRACGKKTQPSVVGFFLLKNTRFFGDTADICYNRERYHFSSTMSLNQSDITPSEDFLQKLSVFARKPVELILKASLKELSTLERDFDTHKNYEARNTLLSWLLSSWRITTFWKPYSIEIDTLGLYINIPKGSKEGIHAHLPFRHINELVLSEIKNRGLMNPDDLNELISQKNIINARGTARLTETTRTFTDRILGLDQIEEICKAVGLDIASVSKNPSLLFETEKKKLISAILSGKRIPLQCLLAYLSDSDTGEVRDHAINLLSIANTLGQELSGTSAYDEVYWFGTAKVAKTRFSKQKPFLQDPKYYEVIKIINAVVNTVDLAADEKNGWCTYWTPWQSQENTFNAAASMSFYHKWKAIDIPFTPERHISGIRENKKGESLLEHSRKLSLPAYTTLDSAVRSYQYFLNISESIGDYFHRDRDGKDAEFAWLMDSLEDILYSEIPGWDFPIPSIQGISKEEQRKTIRKFLCFCEAQYEKCIMGMQKDGSFEPYVVPIKLDAGYIDDCAISNKEKYNTELMESGANFDCIEIPNSNTGGLFYASTRLWLIRGKPLISVVGGCGNLDQDMEHFGRTVTRVASKHAANLCVPATQSGIGNVFGKLRIEYEQANPKLKRDQKMQIFGITPAEAVYYPNNENINAAQSMYALSLPSILIQGTDGWSMGSSHAYFKKMGIFWDQLHTDTNDTTKSAAPHIIIIGNGGTFTIAELNTALKKWAHPLFVRWTGRFADLANELLPRISNLEEDKKALREEISHIVQRMDNNTQLLRDMENPRWWEEMFLFIRLIKRHLQKDEDYSMNLEEMDTRIEGLLKWVR